MSSLNTGKPEMIEWIKGHFQKGETCLDVGACDGKWSDLLSGYLTIDAIEIFAPNIHKHKLTDKYRTVYCGDIRGFKYGQEYDLIIFGDVLEHMTVEDAQAVLKYALPRCRDLIVDVPYQWVNRANYGNKYEIHLQDDLTPELVKQRYPELKPFRIYDRYGYYTKG